MNIIDHGLWTAYTPEVLPEEAPANTLFAKRENDDVDWYDYSRGEHFQKDTVKFMAIYRDYAGGCVVGAAVYDVTMLFPGGHYVGEITDYSGDDPQKDLSNKLYDPQTKEFRDQN